MFVTGLLREVTTAGWVIRVVLLYFHVRIPELLSINVTEFILLQFGILSSFLFSILPSSVLIFFSFHKNKAITPLRNLMQGKTKIPHNCTHGKD